jgi:hypothetical protein
MPTDRSSTTLGEEVELGRGRRETGESGARGDSVETELSREAGGAKRRPTRCRRSSRGLVETGESGARGDSVETELPREAGGAKRRPTRCRRSSRGLGGDEALSSEAETDQRAYPLHVCAAGEGVIL